MASSMPAVGELDESTPTAPPPPAASSSNTSEHESSAPQRTSPISVRSIFRPPAVPDSPRISVASPTPRNPLFDDHISSAHIPGALHLAPDSTIERLAEKQGVVHLIRQLAEDLAHRDRELVNFRRRAEERERALRRMLVEAEISNADIEKRLTGATQQGRVEIEDLMGEALADDDALSVAGSEVETMSIRSNASSVRSKKGWRGFFWGKAGAEDGEETVKGRIPVAKRPVVGCETFSPPTTQGAIFMNRSASKTSLASTRSGNRQASARAPPPNAIYTQNHLAADKSLVKPASLKGEDHSVANWALRMVSQQSAQASEVDGTTPTGPRPRSGSIPDGVVVGHQRRPSSGTTENLQKASARNAANMRSRAPSTSAGSSAPAKSTKFFQDIRDTAERVVPLGLAQNTAAAKQQDAGPVEMDMIIPHAVQPPTLLQSWNQYYPTDHLTDRFGFIYDKRRESVAVKGVVSIKGSYTERRQLEDGVKADHPAERIRHSRPVTPKTQILDVSDAKTPTRWQDIAEMAAEADSPDDESPSPRFSSPKRDEISIDPIKVEIAVTSALIDRLSRPGACLTSPASATPASATMEAPLAIRASQYSSSTSTAEEATVRLLLGQLSDLHDSLQRDRSVKWNEFLRKIRRERLRSDDDENGMPEVMMADGELIGIATLGTEGRGGKQRWKEFKSLVLGGIPVSYRWKIWTECSGATAMKVPGYYEDLLQSGEDDPLVISQISMDINRTLTDNVFFRHPNPGVQKLRQVLLAYSRRNKDVGYCQGMNMIAASLLLIMPSEEDAFWVLCSIVERILPKTYFEPNLLASRADQHVLKHYVSTVLPSLHSHLAALSVELEALTFQWFLSIFTDTLAAEALFRVWDVILCVAGSTFLFQVAIALLRLNEKFLLQCGSAAEVYSYLNKNGGLIHQGISIDGLIRESDGLKERIRRREVERLREVAVGRELEGRTPVAAAGAEN